MLRISDVLTQEERTALTERSDLMAGGLVGFSWLVIFGILALAAYSPSIWTVLLALIVLPGRQLSLAVLMHEAGHNSLFKTEALNRWVGQWLCALPTFADLNSYAAGHLQHHRNAGTEKDPDLPNYQAYPITKESFRRKVIRDLTGQTGFKLLMAIATGKASGIVTEEHPATKNLFAKQVVAQVVLWLALTAMGMGWTYLLWFASFMTTFMFVIRWRQIAEHAAVEDLFDRDPRKNTRTVVAPFWQHFLIAPSFVNYHMEHHFMPTVPCYRLGDLHQILKSRGYLSDVPQTNSYFQVLREAVHA